MKNKGIIAINKPKDWTSFDVVNKLKHRLKPLKVGHLGTLDPMATGVLLITVGKATKLFDIMQEKKKTYVAEFEFGYLTDTLDATGKILDKTDKIPTYEEVLKELPNFIGKINQIPPKYSAKSIQGVRAYDLARQNIEFEIKPKIVDIHNIKVLSFQDKVLKLEIQCGSGTYIRSIGRDIAEKLNSLATMISLVRTKVGNISLNECLEINHIENIDEAIIPIKNILNLEFLKIGKEQASKLLNGQSIKINQKDGIYMLLDKFDVLALIKIDNFNAKMSVFLG